MDNFKNALQIFSPKIYLIVIVTGVTIVTSVLCNLTLGINFEAQLWKRTSVETIFELAKVKDAILQRDEVINQTSERVEALRKDLRSLRITKVDSTLNLYFKQ